jgi:predicted DNA-binding WGR domain protein
LDLFGFGTRPFPSGDAMDIFSRMDAMHDDEDLELRLVDPLNNRFRVYGLTECRTLFGELCLRIVWGRIGNRRLRERSELFPDRAALLQRRDELLGRRRRHGYVSHSTPRTAARARGVENASPSRDLRTFAIASAILDQHGLPLVDGVARKLVARWRDATLAIVRFLEAKGPACST